MPNKKTNKLKKKIRIKLSKPIGRKLTHGVKQITKILDEAKVKYKLIEHKLVYTAHDAAKTTKKKLSEIAKAVLVKADRSWALIVVPAGKYIDLSGVKKALKAKKVSLANEKDISKYLKTKVGLLHPFGSLFNLPPHPTLSPKGARGLLVMLDKSLAKAKKLIASAGSYTHSVEMAVKDFEKLVQPIKGVFAKNQR